MTREEAIKYLIRPVVSSTEIGEIKQKELDAYNMAIEALRHDVIFEQIKWERDVALQTLEEHGIGLGQKADRPTGKWLEVEVLPEVYDIEGVKTWGSEMQCDQCGFRSTAIEGHMAQYNFCPNCGADMRGKNNEA